MMSLYQLFFNPGEVVELRALGLRGKNAAWDGFAGGKLGVVSGYFNDAGKLAAAAAALDKAKPKGVYFTINPCKDVLLARAHNRLICPGDGDTTSDDHIQCLRWFLVDLDAPLLDGTRRPKGVSATDAELAACLNKTQEVAQYLEEEIGFARAIRAFSGNGYHLMYRLPDLPNDEAHRALIKDCMAALALRFGEVTIDVSVVNPARIWKFYGTTGRKGDSTTDRPHRQSYIFTGQPDALDQVPIVDMAVMQRFAEIFQSPAQAPKDNPSGAIPDPSAPPSNPAPPVTKIGPKDLGPIDMEKYLKHYGIGYHVKERKDPRLGEATFYILDSCLFNPDHSGGEAAIIVPRHGALKYQCFHASCKSRTWKDARFKISGDKNLAEFCIGYDPNWTPPRQTGTGLMSHLSIPMLTAAALQNGVQSPYKVPAPTEIDPREFYTKKGKRPVFVPWNMALYLSYYLHPICNTNGIYYHYENGYWKELTKTTIRQIIVHALKHEIQAAWVNNVIDTVLPGMVNREESEWRAKDNPMLINVKNGILNLETRELMPHSPDYGFRNQLPVNYDPEAFSERWDSALKDFFLDKSIENERKRMEVYLAKTQLLQQFFGYCLLRDTRFQVALFLYGTGANGKSTVLDVLTNMVGAENTSSLSLHDLSKQFRAHFLQNKLVNLSTETNTRDPLTMEVFKQVVDGSPITTERKFGEPYQYRPYAKWLVSMNEAMVIPDKSYGLKRRMIVLNFDRRFEPSEIKQKYADYISEEIDGVFNWAIEGLSVLLKRGFVIDDVIQENTDQLMSAMNPLLIFVSECCEIFEGITESTQRMWHAYTAWCTDGHNRALGRNKFYEQILATYTTVKRKEQISKKDDGTLKKEQIFTGIHLTDRGRDYADKGERKSDNMFERKERY